MAQFKPDILTRVKTYCAKYPAVPFKQMLIWAIQIAQDLEPKFDPARAKSFSTPLQHHLKRLNRLAQQYINELNRPRGGMVPYTEQLEQRLEDPRRKSGWSAPHTEPDATRWRRSVWFPPASDGTNIVFDLLRGEQTAGLISGSLSGSLTPVIHYRVTICMQAPPSEDPIAFQDRVSRALATLNSSEPFQFRATIAEAALCDLPAAIEVTKDAGPRKLDPKTIPTARRTTGRTHYEEWKNGLRKVLDKGAPDLGKVPADYSKALGDAAEAERISLSPHEREAMDWIVRDLISPEPHTLTELARNMGISKGYASKLAKRVIKRLRDRLKIIFAN